MAGGAVFDACLAALAPFGRLVDLRDRLAASGNEVHTRKLMRRSRAVVGFWLMHCLGRPAMVDEALADLFARAARGELRAVRRRDLSAVRGAPGPDRPRRAPHHRQGAARPERLNRLRTS